MHRAPTFFHYMFRLVPTSFLKVARNMSCNVTGKSTVATAVAASATASGKQKKGKKNELFLLKTPKGTKDWADKDMVLREAIFDTISSVFKRHGGVTIDTPVFELREFLMGKYGEDSRLIYNLEDQGGELASLRYDLTVPFARFVATNNIANIKRYHIAKVYRRDQPAMTKGRMREFYQCDFDVAGAYEPMIADAEVLAVTCEGLSRLGIHDYKVKINHRKILDGIFEACGVKLEDVRKVSSAVDKLDKVSWNEIKREITQEKGQPEEVADRIGEFVKVSGSFRETLDYLHSAELLKDSESAQLGIKDMESLVEFAEVFSIESRLSFDLSLARGLDYYTGLIFEAVTAGSAPPSNAEEFEKRAAGKEVEDASEYVGIGSVAGGGRYDNLVGMFSSGKTVPCVGTSFGVERLFSIVKARSAKDWDKLSPTHTDVFVMAFGGGEGWSGFLKERMAITKQLWAAGINAEYFYKTNVNPRKQFEAAEKSGAKIAVILGKEEYPDGKVRVKILGRSEGDNGDLVETSNFVLYVKKQLDSYHEDGVDVVEKMIKNL